MILRNTTKNLILIHNMRRTIIGNFVYRSVPGFWLFLCCSLILWKKHKSKFHKKFLFRFHELLILYYTRCCTKGPLQLITTSKRSSAPALQLKGPFYFAFDINFDLHSVESLLFTFFWKIRLGRKWPVIFYNLSFLVVSKEKKNPAAIFFSPLSLMRVV